jgi:hypothetical protein
MELSLWCARMEALIAELEQIDLGYPLGRNEVHAPSSEEVRARLAGASGLPPLSPLLRLFDRCNGVSLPDVHNGYFIHSAELILRGINHGEPRSLSGSEAGSILVFGSDGGGNRFALRGADEIVLQLGEGAVIDGVFDGEGGAVRRIAEDLEAFLERLEADTEAFVRGDCDWVYMA